MKNFSVTQINYVRSMSYLTKELKDVVEEFENKYGKR